MRAQVLRLFSILMCFSLFSCITIPIDTSIYTKNIADALDAHKLYEYMFLEAVPDESVHIYNDFVTFEIKSNQPVLHSGVRSELSINYPYKLGDLVTYKFDVFIPIDFEADKSKRWFVISQWHDQPDPSIGENWKNFPKRSPLVFLYVESRNNIFGVGVNYGNLHSWEPFAKGEWNTFKFNFHWSNSDDGELSVKLNNNDFAYYKGINMLNDFNHYLKVGMYRHPDINTFNEISFRNLSIN